MKKAMSLIEEAELEMNKQAEENFKNKYKNLAEEQLFYERKLSEVQIKIKDLISKGPQRDTPGDLNYTRR